MTRRMSLSESPQKKGFDLRYSAKPNSVPDLKPLSLFFVSKDSGGEKNQKEGGAEKSPGGTPPQYKKGLTFARTHTGGNPPGIA